MEEGSERDMGDNVEREEEGKTLGEELVMDTPERGRINAPLFKFEDSPVFNYINNLSPLETVRPIRISQAFNSYSFSSVPSIFTSPHVSSHKETKFLRRYSVSGPSNTRSSSENGNKVCSNEGLVDIAHKSKEQKESIDVGGCIDESLNEEKFENETPQNQNNSAVNCHDINKICVPSELSGSSSSLIPFGFLSNSEQNREVGRFDWAVISDAADFLIFPSPDTNANSLKGSFLKPLDSESRMLVSNKTQDDGFVGEESTKTENTLFQTGESQLNAIEADEDVPALTRINNQVTEVSNKLIENESTCNLPRGMKRRCLVYDMGGARRKLLDEGSSSSSSILSKCPIISKENHPIPSKPNNNSSRCIVPGIGLHLNALARNSKDDDNNQEILATPRQIINDFGPNTAPANFVNTQDIVNHSLASVDRDVISVSGDILNQSSPKKKRKEENGGETESCKRCNCKKSKCLKLYCECFAAGVYCVEPCSCQDCFNKPIHEDTVLATRKQIESRNPLAFAPKVIRTTDFVPETADESSNTPASARHKRGCNCKKSGCLKKYCECYQGGVGCSINCRCEGCKNVFGRKDGTHIVPADTNVVETEIHEKSVVDRNLSKRIIQNNAEPYQDSALPETPMHFNWAPLHHPFSVKNKPPQALLPMGSSSSTLYNGQKFGIPAFLQPHTQIEKQVQNISKNEIPENLRSPISGIKSCSPNSKRVSPPHNNFESSLSPARTSNRKLILRSIPSFPSLKD